MPNIDERAVPIVRDGASMDFMMEITNFDTSTFRIFKGEEAFAVLDVMVEHFMAGKFLGPFRPDLKDWMGKPFIYNPLFTLEKKDSTPGAPLYRTIFNAAKPRPRTKFQQDVLDGMYDDHPDFIEFMNLAGIRSLNDNMIKMDIKLQSVKEIIRGIYLHDYFWKADL